jgi:pyruvate dehydrogenase E1 component alpha subunit
MIEALTYRIGAHTSSDDPTKYRTDEETAYWAERDPILRFRTFLEQQGMGQAFFDSAEEEGADLAADVRKRTLQLGPPPIQSMFDNVYSEPHPVMEEQRRWLEEYESSFGGDA